MESYNLTEAYLEIYEHRELDEASLSKSMGNLALQGAKAIVKAVRDYGANYPIGSNRRFVSDTIDKLHWASLSPEERDRRTKAKHRKRNTSAGHKEIVARGRMSQEIRDRLDNRREQQESYEYMISYLLDEGYDLTNYDWNGIYSLYEKVVSGYNPFPEKKVDDKIGERVRNYLAHRNLASKSETSPDSARRHRELANKSEGRVDKMIHHTISHDPNKVQSKQRVNRIVGDMKRDRAKWNREDAEADKKRRERSLKYRRSKVHPPSSSDFIPFSKSKKRSSLPHQAPQGVGHSRPSAGRNVSFRKSSTGRSPFHSEEYEYLISHLINEGYASDFASAESICESMSDAWAYEILSEASLSDMYAAEHERNAASIKRDEETLARLAALRASLAKHGGESETPKKTKPTGDVKSHIEKIKAKLERAQDIMDRQDRERH